MASASQAMMQQQQQPVLHLHGSPQQATHIDVTVVLPDGAVPGQQVSCTLPGGRRAMVVAQEALGPGSSMTVRFPDQASQLPRVQQQQQSQPAVLSSPLPTVDVATAEDGRAAKQYWWLYALSWLLCCFALPLCGCCLMLFLSVNYFCCKSFQERARRPQQGLPAKVAAGTLAAFCFCAVFAGVVSTTAIVAACASDPNKCQFEPHHPHHYRDDHSGGHESPVPMIPTMEGPTAPVLPLVVAHKPLLEHKKGRWAELFQKRLVHLRSKAAEAFGSGEHGEALKKQPEQPCMLKKKLLAWAAKAKAKALWRKESAMSGEGKDTKDCFYDEKCHALVDWGKITELKLGFFERLRQLQKHNEKAGVPVLMQKLRSLFAEAGMPDSRIDYVLEKWVKFVYPEALQKTGDMVII
jgi:hypothetical protein